MPGRARCRLRHWPPRLPSRAGAASAGARWHPGGEFGALMAATSWDANATRITADDILRAATTVDEVDAFPPNSALVNEIVWPALAETKRTVSVALGRISIDDMVRRTTAAAK